MGVEIANVVEMLLVSAGLVKLDDVFEKPSVLGCLLLPVVDVVELLCSLYVVDAIGAVEVPRPVLIVFDIVNVASVEDFSVADGSRCVAKIVIISSEKVN